MLKCQRISITWSEELEEMAEQVVRQHAGEMGVLGIPTRSATRQGGEVSFNRSGAIEFALRKLVSEVRKEK